MSFFILSNNATFIQSESPCRVSVSTSPLNDSQEGRTREIMRMSKAAEMLAGILLVT